MSRLAVTGASGFVGRHLVRAARVAGHDVVGLVRSDEAAAVVREAGAEPFAATNDPDSLARAFAACAAVVHLAQIGSERAGQRFEQVNVGLTERVVAAARTASLRRIVYFSGLGVARYGQSRRVTSRYFLSKLRAETEVFGSGLEAVAFRPSYVVGPGDGFVAATLRAMESGPLEVPGDGSYRMQPIAVADACALVLAALERPPGAFPTVFDLVGPEQVAFAPLLERLAAVARRLGREPTPRLREIPIEDAERKAREPAGFRGMGPDELDCLLCDEVSDAAPLEALLRRRLTPLDDALAAAVAAAPRA